MRRVKQAADPQDAAQWREFARYVAGVAMPGARKMSDTQLRRAAEKAEATFPARQVLAALDAADAGRPYRPYTDRQERSSAAELGIDD